MNNTIAQLFFLLIIVAIVVAGLIKNYSIDKGKHLKAKWVHGLLITLLMYSFVGSISQGIKIVFSFSSFLETTPAVGIIPKNAHILLIIIHTVLSILVFVYAGKMIGRKNEDRLRMIKILPFVGFLSSLFFYRGFVQDGDKMGIPDWVILLMGFIIMMGIYIGTMKIYQSKFMVRFFEKDNEIGMSSNENLEELIDELGNDSK